MTKAFTARNIFIVLLIAALFLVPAYAAWAKNNFVLSLFTRIVILAVAATSLNLIMGYGGMVSFGHAAYLGVGGYCVGILAFEGMPSGFAQWPLALAMSALVALVIGVLSLRTRGVYFIMITLAFAQMIYYVGVSLNRYGADDGLTIYRRSQFGSLLNLSNKTVFYYVCLVILMASIYLVWRLVNSRFGMVIQGSRSNDRRMRAIGFPTFRYRLACFVIAGMMCGLAGVLLANHTDFISPAMMHWTRSGDLIVMVVLGGMGSLFGPTIGAVAFLALEEFLPPLIKPFGYVITSLTGIDASHAGEYWQLVFGPMLLLVVLFARGGIDGFLKGHRRG
jgi:branched-chain amino acid transport system permease protein